jgi:hypothetical protein
VAALFVAGIAAASAAEIQLAGLGLGRPAVTVLKKYGNPTEIRVGGAARVDAPQAAEPAAPAGGGMPALPGMPGAPGGDGLFAPAPQDAAPAAAPAAPAGPPEVTWVYKFSNNRTLEVLINPDGIVVQIAVYGVNWPGVATFRGVHLGTSYKDVIFRYGYPESQQQMGQELQTKYNSKHRVVFTFAKKTCVGMTIAL